MLEIHKKPHTTILYGIIKTKFIMKNISFLIILICISIKTNSQEILFDKKLNLKSDFLGYKKNQSLPIINSKKKEIGMFLIDRKAITSFIFDMNYKLKDSFTALKPKSKFRTMLGVTYEQDNYHLIFTNDKNNRFLIKTISVVNKSTNSKELKIKLNKESFIESLNHNGNVYIITLKKGTSVLNLYEIRGNELKKRKTIDLSDYKFSKAFKSLEYILTHTTSAIRENIILSKIDNKNPNSIDITSYPNKIYCFDYNIYITLDIYNDFTKVISINLKNYEYKIKDYKIPKIDCSHDLGVKSNSYILENNIFQVSGCKNELYFAISNIDSKKKVKEWNVKKNDNIDFKNTPLIQLGSEFNSKKYKEIDNTEQILRKIENGNISISAYKKFSNLEVTIGSSITLNTKETLLFFAAAGLSATNGLDVVGQKNNNYHYNPTMYSYENYSSPSTSVYFKSILDENYNNLDGEVKKNAFDKIKTFLDKSKDKISAKTIFKINEDYILGYYNKKDKTYLMLKFNEL